MFSTPPPPLCVRIVYLLFNVPLENISLMWKHHQGSLSYHACEGLKTLDPCLSTMTYKQGSLSYHACEGLQMLDLYLSSMTYKQGSLSCHACEGLQMLDPCLSSMTYKQGSLSCHACEGLQRWTFACHIWPISRGLNRSTPGPTRDLGLYSFNVQILSTFQTSKAWRTYSDLKSSEITRF